MFGRKVGHGIINENSLISLPETIRRYNTNIISDENIILPGIYQAEVNIHYGKKNNTATSYTSFFILGTTIPIFISILLIIFTLLFILKKRALTHSSK